MYKNNRIIIIGGNAAGPSAAAKAKRTNPGAEVILFEAGNFISTGTCELPYLFSGEVKDYKKLVFFTPEEFKNQKGVAVYINHLVEEINRRNRTLKVRNLINNEVSEFEYDKLILTTGSKINSIPKLSDNLDNVFSLKSVGDYIKIIEYISHHDSKKILVVGAGYIGLETADSLSKAKYDVTIYEREALPLPSSDIEIQELTNELVKKTNILFLPGDSKTDYIISGNKVKQLKHTGRFIDFDLVILATGVKPNISLADKAGLSIGSFGGIKVDGRLKTSDPNIFAAGDSVEIKNFITNRDNYIPLATYAHAFGHIAGENAAGGNKIAKPVISNISFRFCDRFISQVGLNQKEAEEHSIHARSVSSVALNKVKVMPDSEKVFGKIIYDKYSGLILGASFVGGNEVSGYSDIISMMILNKIKAINLTDGFYNYTPTLSPFVNILSILGRKIKEQN